MKIDFITENRASGDKLTIALSDTNEILGKHYHESGLSWNLPTQVRYDATFEEWKRNVLEFREIW